MGPLPWKRKKPEGVSRETMDAVSATDVSRETVIPHSMRGPKRAAFDAPEMAEVEPPDDLDQQPPELVLPRPDEPRVFVVANQKGGVGKTTTAVNIATALSQGGLRVLVIDIDPQGNASTALGVEHGQGTPGTYEVLLDGASLVEVAVLSPNAPGMLVVPATIDLAAAELELVKMPGRENRMKRALADFLADNAVDYVFFDCPPSLGLLTLNALVASEEILVPIQTEYYALEGVTALMRTINLVKGSLNDDLKLTTVLLTMFDARTNLSTQVADEVRKHFPRQTLGTTIPRSVRVAEAPSYGMTVLNYHANSAGAVAYLRAAEEIANAVVKEQ